MDLGRTQEALGHMERSLEKSKPDSSIVRKLFHLIAVVRRQLGQKEQAREVCREGLRRFPDDTELLLEESLILVDASAFAVSVFLAFDPALDGGGPVAYAFGQCSVAYFLLQRFLHLRVVPAPTPISPSW